MTNTCHWADGWPHIEKASTRTMYSPAGGGFVMAMLANARDPNDPNNVTVGTAIEDAASSAFLQVQVGAHYRMGKKMAIFGQYSYSPHGRDFMLSGGGHVIEGGIRYAFLSSRESDPTVRR